MDRVVQHHARRAAGDGEPADAVARATELPPVGSVFAAFLGVNPVQQLLGPDVIARLPADKAADLTGQSFFPGLISGPFHSGLVVVFTAAVVMSVVAAAVSLARGTRYVHTDEVPEQQHDGPPAEVSRPFPGPVTQRTAAGPPLA